jgi:hypothetical protein
MSYHHFCLRIESMPCVDCSFTFSVFASSRLIEHVPKTMKDDNTEDQYMYIDEQVEHKISKDPYSLSGIKASPNLVHI